MQTKQSVLSVDLDRHLSAPLVTPDGRTAVVVSSSHQVQPLAWNLESGVHRQPEKADFGYHLAEPVMSPDGRWFAVVTLTGSAEGQTVRVFETATLTQRHEVRLGKGETPREDIAWSMALSPDGRTLAAGLGSGTILLFDVSPQAGPKPWEKTPTDAAKLWELLADADAATAWPAMRELIHRPDVAVELFRKQVRPPTDADKPTAGQLAEWVAGLGAKDFREREAASKALAAVGRLIEPELRQALKNATAPEAQERLKKLLGRLATDTVEEIREVRAVEVLELIGTGSGRKLLGEWATAAGCTVLAREAAGVLRARK